MASGFWEFQGSRSLAACAEGLGGGGGVHGFIERLAVPNQIAPAVDKQLHGTIFQVDGADGTLDGADLDGIALLEEIGLAFGAGMDPDLRSAGHFVDCG